MKTLSIGLAMFLGLSLCCAPAAAQPILKRVEEMLRDQLSGGRPGEAREPGYLGLIGDDTPDSSGVVLLEVYPNQPAAQGGLTADDTITEIDGRPIRTMDDMLAILQDKPPGTKLNLTVRRGGSPQKIAVTLGRRPTDDAPQQEDLPAPEIASPANLSPGPKLGVRTVPVTEDVQRQNALPDATGAQVVSVAVNSAAEKAGIPLGAVIRSVNDQAIGSPEDLAAVIRGLTEPQAKINYVQSGRPLEAMAMLDIPDRLPAANPKPMLETRARPPQSTPLAPAEVAPAQLPVARVESRIEALERRVQELEARIKQLETPASP